MASPAFAFTASVPEPPTTVVPPVLAAVIVALPPPVATVVGPEPPNSTFIDVSSVTAMNRSWSLFDVPNTVEPPEYVTIDDCDELAMFVGALETKLATGAVEISFPASTSRCVAGASPGFAPV
ncbi:hypothetical protein [Methylobacterium tarhaniae]|uniref:hypothetical protein n=1 Tax=Methylobacterium tarhaniae TaxID=1187852 RepID=UPI0012EE5FD0|nr:hypothetical protein [Methylobacterium tarhaniae]